MKIPGILTTLLLLAALLALPIFSQDKSLKLKVTDIEDYGSECRPIFTLSNQSSSRVDELRMKLSAIGHDNSLLGEERTVIFATKPERSGQAFSLTSTFADSKPIFSRIGGCKNLSLLSIDALECTYGGKKLKNEQCDKLFDYQQGLVPIEGL